MASGGAGSRPNPTRAASGTTRRSFDPMLLSALVLLTLTTLWISNQLLPVSLMARLTQEQTGLTIGAAQLELIESRQWIGYALSPAVLGVRLLLAALVIQGVGMIFADELRFSVAFRSAAAAGFASVYGSLMNLLWIWRRGASNLSIEVVGVVPSSVAGFFMPPEASRELLYRMAAEVSLVACLWTLLVALIIRNDQRGTWRSALLVGGTAWAVLAAARIGLHAVFVGIAGR